jgi:ribonuclease G
VAHAGSEKQLTVRLHPEVALFLLEQEPGFLKALRKASGMDLEIRDDPVIGVDEFRLVARPAGRDITEKYAVA